jgi:DHA2 family multidrug resistance protein
VAEAITVPLAGWLAQRFGAVKVFCVAMFMFGVFSALCGLAPSLNILVLFRVLPGLSGGPMIPLCQTLLLRVFPKRLAGQAMGLWSMTTVVAPLAGPILGGFICDTYSWPWVFYINVPVALVGAFLSARLLSGHETPTRRVPLDKVGLGLMVLWIGAFEIMLDKGEDLDWFQSSTIVTLSLVALVGFCAFLIWELTDLNPVINLRVFRSRGYSVTLVVMCLCYGGFFSGIVLIPLWLQTNLGYTATWAGYAVALMGVFAIILSPIVGRLIGVLDLRAMVFTGVMIMALCMFLRSGFASNIDYGHIVIPQLLQGFGIPLFFAPIYSLALNGIKPQEIAGAAGLLSFTRTMSGAFGTSLVTTSWSNAARSNRVELLNQMNGGSAFQSVQAAGLGAVRSLGQLETQFQTQAVMLATDSMFLGIACVMMVGAFSIWLVPKPDGSARASGGH